MAPGREPTTPEVREAAVRLLSRREHSRLELRTKLVGKGWPEDLVDVAVTELADAGLQSDERFAESFARQRAERSYGPRRIRAELTQRGIDSAEAARAIEALDVDFRELAADFYRRKYGSDETELSFSERARRSQALYRRGFEAEHIRALV
ncbi:MAG: regulatory protein RecX [Candidatus Wenzhouxiangella sp. M2_3B_020]